MIIGVFYRSMGILVMLMMASIICIACNNPIEFQDPPETISLLNWQVVFQHDNHLQDIWGSSSDNVFAVGYEGTILHYDGLYWSQMESGTKYNLNSVWGMADSDVFTVGDNGTILYYDGVSWSQFAKLEAEYLLDIWGTSSNDLFVTGSSGCIVHYDGKTWEYQNSNVNEHILCVWGTSSHNVLAAGDHQTILLYDGEKWKDISPHDNSRIIVADLWGSSDSYFAVGTNGTIYTYNDGKLKKMESGVHNSLSAIWGNSENGVYAAGGGIVMHYNGKKWRILEKKNDYERISGIWTTPQSGIFAVTFEGKILHSTDLE